MRLRLLTLALLALAPISLFAEGPDNQLTQEEKAAGWKLLFDGTSINGWRSVGKPDAPKEGWVAQDGELRLLKKGGVKGGGDIITTEMFSDFELTWDWKISPGGNSGVKYNLPNADKNVGCEYQLLDDEKHPDAKLHDGKRITASLYDVIAPAADKKLNPVGEWNHSRILISGNHVEHWLNGGKVVSYDFGSDEMKKLIGESKFNKVEGWGVKTKSPILLQDHGNEVTFKNIKIRIPAAK